MRNPVRLAGVAATAAAMLALGSPAFADDGGKDGMHGKGGDSVTTTAADGGTGGQAGDGGKGEAKNDCPSVGVDMGTGGNPTCSALSGGDANGGAGSAEANDDTKKFKKGAEG